jgi:hypothetical protein
MTRGRRGGHAHHHTIDAREISHDSGLTAPRPRSPGLARPIYAYVMPTS